jgi:hypothetical protein
VRLVEFILEDSDITLTHEPTDAGGVEIYAHKGERVVGRTIFYSPRDGKSHAMMVWVPEDLRRQGIASRMYSYARHELGLDIEPSDLLSDLGEKFWTKAHESQTLDEAPMEDDTIDQVDAWAKRRGFSFVSSGSDARVYFNSAGNAILKVLVGEEGVPTRDAAVGFLTFYNFCKNRTDNPHLPKFLSPPKRVVINGESIIYIEMEMLKHVNKRMERIIDDLERHVDKPWSELGKLPPNLQHLINDETKAMLKGPKEKQRMWYNFYRTLCDLYEYYNRRNPVGIRKKSTSVMWDMGGSNIMSRNLVPVISDPFIID